MARADVARAIVLEPGANTALAIKEAAQAEQMVQFLIMNEKKYRVYVCGNMHCLVNGKDAILRALETAVWEHGLDADVDVRVSGCQNQCDFGPNVKVWPGPYQYTRLTPEAVRRIVAEHLQGGEPVRDLLGAGL